ncbi:hypothetical protein RBH26_01625 [Natronolimnohabitans sp. A-GB9]|uniref:hypothetical protein n=1 Tax=Natronolimnohabitans sp. A-GB9 TaxID=3069757 RepID=UPI0027B853FB|nr:hypothetical protein [Natronolimnohabitans sp. A-GB9]MDQ2049175.1 hypothetical protein [Natronolimnohabitans sp. A-GB9]
MTDDTPHRRVKRDDPVPEILWCLIDAVDDNRIVGTYLTRKAAKEAAVEKAERRGQMTADFPVVAVHFKDMQDLYDALEGGIRDDVLVPTPDGFEAYQEFMDGSELEESGVQDRTDRND